MVDKFAVITRQGFIPNQPKPNQDSHIILKNFCNIEGLWLFGVCDGHGVNGHLISDFVKKHVPRILSSMINLAIGGNAISKHKPGDPINDTSKFKKKIIDARTILPPLVRNSSFDHDDIEFDPKQLVNSFNRSEAALMSMDQAMKQDEQQRNNAFNHWFKTKAS